MSLPSVFEPPAPEQGWDDFYTRLEHLTPFRVVPKARKGLGGSGTRRPSPTDYDDDAAVAWNSTRGCNELADGEAIGTLFLNALKTLAVDRNLSLPHLPPPLFLQPPFGETTVVFGYSEADLRTHISNMWQYTFNEFVTALGDEQCIVGDERDGGTNGKPDLTVDYTSDLFDISFTSSVGKVKLSHKMGGDRTVSLIRQMALKRRGFVMAGTSGPEPPLPPPSEDLSRMRISPPPSPTLTPTASASGNAPGHDMPPPPQVRTPRGDRGPYGFVTANGLSLGSHQDTVGGAVAAQLVHQVAVEFATRHRRLAAELRRVGPGHMALRAVPHSLDGQLVEIYTQSFGLGFFAFGRTIYVDEKRPLRDVFLIASANLLWRKQPHLFADTALQPTPQGLLRGLFGSASAPASAGPGVRSGVGGGESGASSGQRAMGLRGGGEGRQRPLDGMTRECAKQQDASRGSERKDGATSDFVDPSRPSSRQRNPTGAPLTSSAPAGSSASATSSAPAASSALPPAPAALRGEEIDTCHTLSVVFPEGTMLNLSRFEVVDDGSDQPYWMRTESPGETGPSLQINLNKIVGSGHSANVWADDSFSYAIKIADSDDEAPLANEHVINTYLNRAAFSARSRYYGAFSDGFRIVLIFDLLSARPFQSWSQLSSRKDAVFNLIDDFHSHGFVHGDLKPSNILINNNNSDNKLYLIDFEHSSCSPAERGEQRVERGRLEDAFGDPVGADWARAQPGRGKENWDSEEE
ncbi:hypothetical protein JCM10207_004848 [Rhodosporidiobolus poonsookiae]